MDGDERCDQCDWLCESGGGCFLDCAIHRMSCVGHDWRKGLLSVAVCCPLLPTAAHSDRLCASVATYVHRRPVLTPTPARVTHTAFMLSTTSISGRYS